MLRLPVVQVFILRFTAEVIQQEKMQHAFHKHVMLERNSVPFQTTWEPILICLGLSGIVDAQFYFDPLPQQSSRKATK